MPKILFLFSAVLLISASNPLRKEAGNYLAYHQAFTKIEALMAEEDFAAADSTIAALFSSFEVKFVKDYVIAAQLAVLNHRKEKALEWLQAGMKRGIKIECLKSIKVLSNNLSTEDWNTLEAQFLAARKEYRSNIDLALAYDLHKRYEREQASKGSDHYQSVVYSNFAHIKGLIAKEGFPGEDQIGIDDAQYAASIADCGLGNSSIIVTLLHYDYPVSEIGEAALMRAIEAGSLHPREYAMMYNFEKSRVSVLYKTSKKRYPALPDYKFNFPFGESSDDLGRVDADRFKFGICSCETDRKKAMVGRKYGMKLDFNYR